MAINLLPTDLAPGKSVNKLVSAIKKFNVIAVALFILLLLSSLGYTFFLSTQIRVSTAEKERLKVSLASLEQTEQSVVLLKDRIKQADKALPALDSYDTIANFQGLYNKTSSLVILRDVKIVPQQTEFSVLVTSSTNLVEFVTQVAGDTNYKRIELTSFSFTPTAGYLLTLKLFE